MYIQGGAITTSTLYTHVCVHIYKRTYIYTYINSLRHASLHQSNAFLNRIFSAIRFLHLRRYAKFRGDPRLLRLCDGLRALYLLIGAALR